MMIRTAIALLALLAVAVSARPVCHNITGTCLPHGFECISGEVVTHAQRCNGVEDCSDGTDEFLCEHEDHRPLAERTEEERHQFQQASCVNCNCAVTAYNIASGSAWFGYAILAPTDVALMTGTGAYAGRPCRNGCTSSLTVGFYKKNRICRGWLCCARQRQCIQCFNNVNYCGVTTTQSTTNRCY